MIRKMNRRNFIEQSLAYGLTGLAMPSKSFSADPPVKIAVIGTGGRGTDLIRKLSTIERAEIVGVCDNYAPHLEKGGTAAGPQAKRYDDYHKMLKNLKPEAVVIASPLYLHFEMAKAAIEGEAAVFCEKTMCHSIEQAKDLAKLVRKRKAIFQVGLQRRASAIYQQGIAMIEAGYLGQIYSIKSQWHRNNDWRRPVPVGKDHPNWEKLEHHLNWRLFWPYSQGLMTELGAHQMDVAHWALGQPPKRVLAMGGNDYWRDGREVFDNVYCMYEYEIHPQEDKPYTVRATYSSIQSNAYEGASELIMGTKGTLLLTEQIGLFYKEASQQIWGNQNSASQTAEMITAGKTLKLDNDPWARRGKPFELQSTGDSTRDELIAFLDCVQRKDPKTICDVEVGLANTATVLIANQAIKENRTVDYPL